MPAASTALLRVAGALVGGTLVAVPAVAGERLRLAHRQGATVEYVDLAGFGRHEGLRTVRWISEAGAERRVDVYAFDCAGARYVHARTELYRHGIRQEAIVLAPEHWSVRLAAVPSPYPAQAVHRARAAACASGRHPR